MRNRLDSIFSSFLCVLSVLAIAIAVPRDHSISAAPRPAAADVEAAASPDEPQVQSDDDEKIGARPYEMDWAGRVEEVRPALVDFENLDGWKVETTNSVARFERSREEQMYGQYVGKLTYRCEGQKDAKTTVDILAPEPLPIADDADALSCWMVGNNWAWEPNPTTPRVRAFALFRSQSGEELSLLLETVDWREWFLIYRPFTKEFRAALGPNASFIGFRVEGGTNAEDRTIYFDSFCVFKEELEPLEFTPRAKPGIDLFEGQPLGVNSGEGRLPFPTTPDTILPDSSKNLRKPAIHYYEKDCDFVYEGTDGTLVYKYVPKKGDWSDLTVTWDFCDPITLGAGGGVVQLVGEDDENEDVEKAELLELKPADSGVVARWNMTSKSASAIVEYRMQLRGKSLIVDTLVQGKRVPDVSFGRLENIVDAKVFSIPYYLYHYARRPGVALVKALDSDVPLFISGHIDWYRSGASYLRGDNEVGTFERNVSVGKPGAFKMEKRNFEYAIVNGGAEYRPKTDGERNDVYERFVFTVSPDFNETLPSIPNPKSPYRSVAGSGVWNARGASTREGDKAFWRKIWRLGMRRLIVTDHEVCWRDGGESFTFRTKPAPGKGGDQGWIDYSRFMQDELGFVYGPYNNFTDFAPVNEYWSPDMISRGADLSLQRAWARCYAPKPTRAVEYCEKLTPINQEKFQFSCAYCDVHSSVPAWTRTDYDARVPGAGTFMSVFYPYGEIFLLQKQNWKGPTYSEGPHHAFYAGLTDGNYAQDQPYNLFVNPWLVDFDLLKIHEQEVDFGMGNISMFAPGYQARNANDVATLLDRFLAATLAFGHSGYLALDLGPEKAAQSYFMIQQIASRYTQSSVESIRYIDADGNALDTSAALAADVVKRSQVFVRYKDGTVVVSNGSAKEELRTEIDGRSIVLPPNGYLAYTSDGAIYVESSLDETGRRFDYCESPEYIYVNGRGSWTERPRACSWGAGVCRILGDDRFEIIPQGATHWFGFKIVDENETATAVALDYDQKELGPANVKYSRGFLFVEPVDGAFSYIVTKKKNAEARRPDWTCDSFDVVKGERVVVSDGTTEKTLTIPEDAVGWTLLTPDENDPERTIDFLASPMVEPRFSIENGPNEDVLSVEFETRQPKVDYELVWNVDGSQIEKSAGTLDRSQKRVESVVLPRCVLPKALAIDESNPFGDFVFINASADSPVVLTPYVQGRDLVPSRELDGTGAVCHFDEALVCGGDSRIGYFVHPPYETYKGRTFLRYHFQVPENAAFFALNVGKVDGSDSGDGVLFQVAVAKFDGDELVEGSEKTLAELTVKEHVWKPLCADLFEYAGQTIDLLVIADMGKDTKGDWGAVADMRLETKERLGEVLGANDARATIEMTLENANGTRLSTVKGFSLERQEQTFPFEDYVFINAPVDSPAVLTPYVQGRDRAPSRDFNGTGATHHFEDSLACGGVDKPAYFVHPPYESYRGRTFLRYRLQLPEEPALFKLNVGKKDGSDVGEGILFQVAVAEFDGDNIVDGSEKTLAEVKVNEHVWTPLSADLSEYAGQTIDLLVISDMGGDTIGDWGAVADMRLETKEKRAVWKIKKAE